VLLTCTWQQDSDQSTPEVNPLVAQESGNTVAEAERIILSAHEQSMSGSEQGTISLLGL
jgi:hypothetical protein